jgi:hypothetical protein
VDPAVYIPTIEGFAKDGGDKLYYNLYYLGGIGVPYAVSGLRIGKTGQRDLDLAFWWAKMAWEIKVSKNVKYGGHIKHAEIPNDRQLSIEMGWTIAWEIFPDTSGRVRVSQRIVDELGDGGISVTVHHFSGPPSCSQEPSPLFPFPIPNPIPNPIPAPSIEVPVPALV